MQELMNKKILIADDEPQILGLIRDILLNEGFYNIFTAKSCAEVRKLAANQSIALYLLDVNFPDGDGFSLMEELNPRAPVIFLTARGEAEDRIRGLYLGADDYIVKPFLPKELLLRVTAVLKRVYRIDSTQSSFRLSDRTVNFETASVIIGDTQLPLTAKEYILIKKLRENKNRIVTSDSLCMAAWGEEYYGCENTLMVHIRRLRKKLEREPSEPVHLITVKGLGYKLVVDDE